MHECNANANPNEKHFWSQEIERISIRTILDRLTKTKVFCIHTLLNENLELGFLVELAQISTSVLA